MEKGAPSDGWTLKSIAIAAGVSLAGMMIVLQLIQWHLWPEMGWSYLVIPAMGGSVFLALKHPGTGLLTTFVFFPLLLVLMFYAGACFPLS
jgi:hypothetical protein